MRVGKILRTVALGSLISLGASSCRGPLKEVKASKDIITKVDSISETSKKVLKDTAYKCFRYDTLKLSDDFKQNPNSLVSDMEKSAKINIPKTKVGTKLENKIFFSDDKMKIYPTLEPVYKDNFIDTKSVIRSSKMFSDNAKNLYVPVEIYGHKNPEISKTH